MLSKDAVQPVFLIGFMHLWLCACGRVSPALGTLLPSFFEGHWSGWKKGYGCLSARDLSVLFVSFLWVCCCCCFYASQVPSVCVSPHSKMNKYLWMIPTVVQCLHQENTHHKYLIIIPRSITFSLDNSFIFISLPFKIVMKIQIIFKSLKTKFYSVTSKWYTSLWCSVSA